MVFSPPLLPRKQYNFFHLTDVPPDVRPGNWSRDRVGTRSKLIVLHPRALLLVLLRRSLLVPTHIPEAFDKLTALWRGEKPVVVCSDKSTTFVSSSGLSIMDNPHPRGARGGSAGICPPLNPPHHNNKAKSRDRLMHVGYSWWFSPLKPIYSSPPMILVGVSTTNNDHPLAGALMKRWRRRREVLSSCT